MRVSKEYRRWLNSMRAFYGKLNGWLLDCPVMECKDARSKRNYRRNIEKRIPTDA